MRLMHEFQAVERMVPILGRDRRENDAEHSYSLSMLAWYLADIIAPSLAVNPDAAGPLPANQSIVLEGIDLSQAYGSSDEATIIQGMLDDGSLKVV